MHGCNATQEYVRKRQRRGFEIWDKSKKFSKKMWCGIPNSNYFACVFAVIYGTLYKG